MSLSAVSSQKSQTGWFGTFSHQLHNSVSGLFEKLGGVHEEEKKSWSLKEKKVRLIRLGDRLNYEIVDSQGSTRGPILIPEGKSIDKAIAELMVREPKVEKDNAISFLKPLESQKQSDPLEEEIKTWFLKEKKVRLIRLGNQLNYEIVDSQGSIRGPIPFPEGKSIEEAIAQLMTREPEVGKDNTPNFLKPIKSPDDLVQQSNVNNNNNIVSKPIKSQLDGVSEIDEDHWAVTIADTLVSPTWNPKTWGGHANLFIECVKSGTYTMYKADLAAKECREGTGYVDLTEIKKFDPHRIAHKTVTWIRSKELVNKMIKDIKYSHAIPMNLRGQDAFGGVDAENCFTWARKELALAGVFLYTEEKVVPPLIVQPKSNISSTSLSSKERIRVRIKEFYLGFDITKEIDQKVSHVPWKLATSDNSEMIKVNGKVTPHIYKYPDVELGHVVIKLIFEDGKIREVDAAEIIKCKIRTISNIFSAMKNYIGLDSEDTPPTPIEREGLLAMTCFAFGTALFMDRKDWKDNILATSVGMAAIALFRDYFHRVRIYYSNGSRVLTTRLFW